MRSVALVNICQLCEDLFLYFFCHQHPSHIHMEWELWLWIFSLLINPFILFESSFEASCRKVPWMFFRWWVHFQRGCLSKGTDIHPYKWAQHEQNHMSRQLLVFTVASPPTKIYLWQVFLSFSPGIGLCLLGRDVKHRYNVLVSDQGRGPSLNLPLIFGVTGLCLSETGLRDGGPGWSTAPSSCDHQYSLIFTLSLCSSRSPFAQRFSNIHCHQENKYFHPRACGDEEVTFLCRFKKLWMALAVSPSPSLEISH